MSKFPSLLMLSVLLPLSSPAQDNEKAPVSGLQAARFGETIYSVYLDDHLTSLTNMAVARTRGLNAEQLDIVTLLEGGVGLGYGMSSMAADKLTEQTQRDNEVDRPLAWYWLARLSFTQGKYAQGLQAYDYFERDLEASDQDVDDVLTPSQWYDLNYEAAQASLSLGETEITRFQSALPDDHVTLQYLDYNEAVASYAAGELDEAINQFAQVEAQLTEQLSSKTQDTSWLTWIGWWQDREDETIKQAELEALLNQVHLSHGQAMLARGRFTDALGVFGEISGQSLVRDEALLQYGWGLARRNDWPLAMGVWDYLAKQPDNLYTLQATHALALGYAQQDGEVQAHDTLQALVTKLDGAINDLDNLSSNMQSAAFWSSLAAGVSGLQVDSTSQESQTQWQSLWPAAHQDMLMGLMLQDGEQTDQLAQLEELFALRESLLTRQAKIDTYTRLLDERDISHAQRASLHQNNPTKQQLQTILDRINVLKMNIANADAQISGASSADEALQGLSVFADEANQQWLARLSRADARYAHLVTQRKMRPKYAQRLARIKGILLWNLSESYQDAKWQTSKAMTELDKLAVAADQRQNQFSALIAQPNVTAPQRERLEQMASRITVSLNKTNDLIKALETKLIANADQAIAQRRYYLSQQRNMSQLAILQLKDSWRATSQGAAEARTGASDE